MLTTKIIGINRLRNERLDRIDGLILGIKYDKINIKAKIELRIYINLSKKFNFFIGLFFA
tara:strand:- start:500 stop:679 length:180 start_codon:yes stop_codon:yes gene_type:complete